MLSLCLCDQLAGLAIDKFGQADAETCYLFPAESIAQACQAFLLSRTPPVQSRIVAWHTKAKTDSNTGREDDSTKADDMTVYAVFLPLADSSVGKQFWQHAGDGISSRFAARYLALLTSPSSPSSATDLRTRTRSGRGFSRNKHYAKLPSASDIDLSSSITLDGEPSASTSAAPVVEEGTEDATSYVEERYGRNLARTLGPLAKTALKRRIAGVLREAPSFKQAKELALSSRLQHLSLASEAEALSASGGKRSDSEVADGVSQRGVEGLTEHDVFLYPTGMSAIFHSHQLAMHTAKALGKRVEKSVCFGCVSLLHTSLLDVLTAGRSQIPVHRHS